MKFDPKFKTGQKVFCFRIDSVDGLVVEEGFINAVCFREPNYIFYLIGVADRKIPENRIALTAEEAGSILTSMLKDDDEARKMDELRSKV